MTSPTVTRAGSPDLDQVAPLFDAYRRFYEQPSEPGRVRAFLTDRLRNQDSVILLARLEATAPAVGFTQLYPTFSSVSIGRAFVLNDLFVDPTAQGRGIGEALLQAAARIARATGALYLELETGVTNLAAQRLYERLGWKRETAFHRYGLDLRSDP
jgi:ribosomal protein S18 acetylase RimI-like enzyme